MPMLLSPPPASGKSVWRPCWGLGQTLGVYSRRLPESVGWDLLLLAQMRALTFWGLIFQGAWDD